MSLITNLVMIGDGIAQSYPGMYAGTICDQTVATLERETGFTSFGQPNQAWSTVLKGKNEV